MLIRVSDHISKNRNKLQPVNYSENRIHLKIYYGDQNDFPDDLSHFREYLSNNEYDRSRRFKFLRDERTYVISHALLNKKISKILNTDFKLLTINYFANKKPFVENHRIDFNLSHSSDYFAFIISNHENSFVGIDIEVVRDNLDIEPIMNNYFHKNEIRYISDSNIYKGALHQKFYKIWTRKEAFLKMLGIGLSDQLSELDLSPGERESLFFKNNSLDIPGSNNACIYTLVLCENLVLSLSANCPVKIIPERCNNF